MTYAPENHKALVAYQGFADKLGVLAHHSRSQDRLPGWTKPHS
jgi:hypothetical protein